LYFHFALPWQRFVLYLCRIGVIKCSLSNWPCEIEPPNQWTELSGTTLPAISGSANGKGKGHFRTGHEGPEGEYKYKATPSLTSALDGVGVLRHVPAALPAGKTRYPLYRRLGVPQARSGRVRKISPWPGFDPWIVQPVASRYTNRDIPTLISGTALSVISGTALSVISVTILSVISGTSLSVISGNAVSVISGTILSVISGTVLSVISGTVLPVISGSVLSVISGTALSVISRTAPSVILGSILSAI
jgi:hypothetical protein